MAILQSLWALGRKSPVTHGQAGLLIKQTYTFTVASAITAATDIIEIAALPQGAQLVEAELIQENATAATTYAVGFMSGRWRDNDPARTVDTAVFAALRADTLRRLESHAAAKIAPVDVTRSIGIKLGADEAAGPTKLISLTLGYHL